MAKSIESYIPLSETAYYILLSLTEPRHGYGIIKYVESLTKGRIKLGSGTVYTTLGKMTKAHFIEIFQDKDRKTVYVLTDTGKKLISLEIDRIKIMYSDTLHQEGIFNEKN